MFKWRHILAVKAVLVPLPSSRLKKFDLKINIYEKTYKSFADKKLKTVQLKKVKSRSKCYQVF